MRKIMTGWTGSAGSGWRKNKKNRGTTGLRDRFLTRFLAVFCALSLFALCGCGDGEGSKVVFTAGLEKDEIFRIGDEICRTPEMMVYLTTTQEQYESVYGEKIWNTALDGVTLEESVKEIVLEKVAQIKTMNLLGKERGLELDDTDKARAKAAAKEYMAGLTEAQAESLGITEEITAELYEEYAMANKVYQDIIQDVNPEISDDEARIITVQHILIRTYSRDPDGNRVEFLTAEKQAAYEEASDVRDQAVAGEKTFEELASRYSQDSTLTYSFGKGEMDPAFEEAAFRLATDEISPVVESDSGYHIIKCISSQNPEETAANKIKLLEERKNEVFGEEYETFLKSQARKLNQEAWDGIGLVLDGTVPDVDFFAIYEKHFGQ